VGTPAELYNEPTNLFVAGFIGSPAMNFMAAELSGGKVKLPIGEADLPEGLGDGRDGKVVAGLRPESFEDAEMVGDLRDERGVVFEAEIDLVEERLEETGVPEVREGQEQIVARLDPASKIKRGDTAQLWADTSKLHLFDAESGERLGREGEGDRTGDQRSDGGE
jgi:multiple sugar transport system ATP-binding protein